MEWLTSIHGAVSFMETHLRDDIGLEDVARAVHLSPFFLQRGFSLMTGVGVGEYLRNRRLYEAALDLQKTGERVIDIALKYGYETPESFARAFVRFHGATPTQVREGAAIRPFLPLTILLSIQGGSQMDYKITPMFPFKVIGFQRAFDYETSYAEIPRFWDEICEKYANNVYDGNAPANPYEQALVDNCIGEYGVCIDDLGGGRFRYLIAGRSPSARRGDSRIVRPGGCADHAVILSGAQRSRRISERCRTRRAAFPRTRLLRSEILPLGRSCRCGEGLLSFSLPRSG